MRQKQGVITSANMQRTVTVTVHRHVFHPLYKKLFLRSKNFLADSGEFTDLIAGDTVVISECRPLSKRKRFRVTEVVARTPRVSELVEEEEIQKIQAMQRNQKKSSSASSHSGPEGPSGPRTAESSTSSESSA
jgi:small subunit ribosomal protein S17